MLLFFILALFTQSILSGCASLKQPEPEFLYTMNTDMYPHDISRAEYYEQMAVAYAQDDQSEKAIDYFRLSLLHNPTRISAYLALSDEYRKVNRPHLAAVELGQALKIEPRNLAAMKRLGDLYLSAQIYSKAREVYFEMLTLDNKLEDAQWAVFYIYKVEKDYSQALEVLSKIESKDSNAYKICFERALVYKALKDYQLYNVNLAKAFELNPRDRQIVLEYANNSFSQKNFKNSTSALSDYSDTHDYDLEISQNLSYSAVQSENYDVALREFGKQRLLVWDRDAIDLKIAHVYYLTGDLDSAEKLYLSLINRGEIDEARFYLAQIFIARNKPDDAAFILERMPVNSEYYGEAQVRLALYKQFQGESDDAINIVRSAFIKRPDQLVIYKTYADFLIEGKRYVETIALLEKGISLFPRDEELRLKMAYLHYRLNNQRGFKKQIFAALKINPQSANAYSMLSELWYLKRKKPEEVIYFVKKALELKSNNKNVKPLLAWALMQQDNPTEAVAIFEEFYEENPKESFFARSLAQVYSRGDVRTKARELAKAATVLESNEGLKSRFLFKPETQQVDSESYKENPTRLPASLENN